MPCFAAFRHAASRHMNFVVNLVRTFGESAFFNRTLSVRCIAGFELRRDEMIFERTSPSCYSFEMFAAFVERSRGEGTTCIAQARGFPDFLQGCAGRPIGSPRLRRAGSARAGRANSNQGK